MIGAIAAGYEADPPLVKRLAIELYVHPERQPMLSSEATNITKVVARWIVGGVFGRNSSKRARKAFVAAEQLDLDAVMSQWKTPVALTPAEAEVWSSSEWASTGSPNRAHQPTDTKDHS